MNQKDYELCIESRCPFYVSYFIAEKVSKAQNSFDKCNVWEYTWWDGLFSLTCVHGYFNDIASFVLGKPSDNKYVARLRCQAGHGDACSITTQISTVERKCYVSAHRVPVAQSYSNNYQKRAFGQCPAECCWVGIDIANRSVRWRGIWKDTPESLANRERDVCYWKAEIYTVATSPVALRWMCDSPLTGCARRITPYIGGANKQW